MPHNGNGQEQPAKEHAPETPCAPKLDPVTRVVEADGLFDMRQRDWHDSDGPQSEGKHIDRRAALGKIDRTTCSGGN